MTSTVGDCLVAPQIGTEQANQQRLHGEQNQENSAKMNNVQWALAKKHTRR
jgi:hypothetical protein